MKPNSLIPSKYRHFIEQNAWMVGGNILFAIGVNMIVTPLGLYNGGFMGLAQLLRLLCVNVLHIPVPAGFDLVGIIYFLENVPLFFVAYKVVGKEFCFKSLVSIGIASLALALVPVPATPIMHDTLAACFVGGVIAGAFVTYFRQEKHLESFRNLLKELVLPEEEGEEKEQIFAGSTL